MKTSLLCLSAILICATTAHGAFHGDPPDANHPWAVHDQNRPQPPRVEPGKTAGAPPSAAIVLFDGTAKSFKTNWLHDNPKAMAAVRQGLAEANAGATAEAPNISSDLELFSDED